MDTHKRELLSRVTSHLKLVYPQADLNPLALELLDVMGLTTSPPLPAQFNNPWDESDVWLITYGDSICDPAQKGLVTLRKFLNRHLDKELNGVHVLPFFPYTSDDGFAVSDYLSVRKELGGWDDIQRLAGDRRVMADVVINHCSSEHPWFKNFIKKQQPGRDYFVTMDAGADLRQVVRPRTSPLLRPSETEDGDILNVWCTFSHDQVDLNFANPAVLIEFIRILRFYLDCGVRVFRLDAVAFLWKEEGSSSLNLPQTHEIVRLLRTLIEHVDNNAILITETNIPNRENLSYFGNSNEAHMVYNFSLPPLLLHSLWSGDCHYLKNWLMSMPPAQFGTTYFNFLASHDGIGLRPAEGLLDDGEIEALVCTAESFGGQVSWRALEHGARKPYELNIALFDALQGTHKGKDQYNIERFVCAHAIMLALEGIPALYIHSLIGTHNDQPRVTATGHARAINRHQWDSEQLEQALADPQSEHHQVFQRLKALIQLRKLQPAFHPNALQFTLHLSDAIFGFRRHSLDRTQNIFVLNNITDQSQSIPLTELNLMLQHDWFDLISGETYDSLSESISLAPYQSVWISNRRDNMNS